ncbi:hypothetical protein BU24DRAFT_468219 [Aaosphaeria arxii CBS 175.79]|uniref:Uncharacterized protein n=1 Tax=Aaosphaeria arxii CBS 175.79 TaxID=1450172 RepID=A0A6A5X8K8_9PLEO|nr:uncharacterized protein BU24DRAFT_468219 [Aaosphaeria arxii CBS 175.79]KAF2009240.1 hypothetical protein BU24DRAFT_468219 [Aaosphaeria arxii CBS 175.79]
MTGDGSSNPRLKKRWYEHRFTMIQLRSVAIVSALGLISHVAGLPSSRTYDQTISCPTNPNITLSYKPLNLYQCKPDHPRRRSFVGQIDIAPFTLDSHRQTHNVSTSFWFSEALPNPQKSPLTLLINNRSSLLDAVRETPKLDPCLFFDSSIDQDTSTFNRWRVTKPSNFLDLHKPIDVQVSNTSKFADKAYLHSLHCILTASKPLSASILPFNKDSLPVKLDFVDKTLRARLEPEALALFSTPLAGKKTEQELQQSAGSADVEVYGLIAGYLDSAEKGCDEPISKSHEQDDDASEPND